MGTLLAYILKSALYIVCFYLFYRLLLSRDTFYRFNRHALVIMLILSIGLPLVEFSHEVAMTESYISVELDPIMGLTILDDEVSDEAQTFPWMAWGIILYLAGITFFTLKTIISYLSLAKVLHSGNEKKLSDYGIACNDSIHLLVHHDKMSPFSWMNYIVVSEEDLQANSQSIVLHEVGHIRHHHTWDLLFTEVCLILQWFNPAIWLMRRELQTLHEYQADEHVLDAGIDARQYQLLLIEKATGTRLQSITCSLHQSSIKKRITMMLKKKSNPWARAKMLFAIPLAITGVAVLSTPAASAITAEISDCKISEIFDTPTAAPNEVSVGKDSENSPISQENGAKSKEIVILINEKSELMFNEQYATWGEIPTLLKESNIDANTKVVVLPSRQAPMSSVTRLKEILRKAGVTKLSYAIETVEPLRWEKAVQVTPKKETKSDNDELFTRCEVEPQFPGGESALMEYIKNEMHYPSKCKEEHIEGRVTLSFVIEKDGSVSNIEEMRSPNPQLTSEAKRIIRNMPQWTPGTQRGHKVRVKFVIPITFKLD